jgi:hypothetical protein
MSGTGSGEGRSVTGPANIEEYLHPCATPVKDSRRSSHQQREFSVPVRIAQYLIIFVLTGSFGLFKNVPKDFRVLG